MTLFTTSSTVVFFVFFRKDLPEQTSSIRPSRLQRVIDSELLTSRSRLLPEKEEEEQNDGRSRLLNYDGLTGREIWTEDNETMNFIFPLFEVVVCLTWLCLQQIGCDDGNFHTHSGLHPQNLGLANIRFVCHWPSVTLCSVADCWYRYDAHIRLDKSLEPYHEMCVTF